MNVADEEEERPSKGIGVNRRRPSSLRSHYLHFVDRLALGGLDHCSGEYLGP